eukprot:03951.XXX_34934_34106_1 [CDS] Oithona nana genome sequencing.
MAVCGDIFLFSFCLLDTGGLIFILIYFIITLSDLECDYLNAQECCSKLNFWNVPKLWCQLVILFILITGGHWLMFLINLPICVYLARRFFYFPRGNIGEYDPAEIHNQGMMKKHLKGVVIHLAWQLLGFFIFLYCLLDAVMKEPVLIQHDDDVEVFNNDAKHTYYQTRGPPTIDDEM